MKKYICNPINLSYKYQILVARMPQDGGYRVLQKSVVREAADPSCVLFKGRYYLFPSMSKGYWVSGDLSDWEYVALDGTPSYDYAPDVCVAGEKMYFSASKKGEPCKFYVTDDPAKGFEEAATAFEFWDPALYFEDGRFYFYWGCTNTEPIYGVELCPVDFSKKGEKKPLIAGNDKEHGFERVGDDHVLPPLGEDASDYEKYMRMFVGTAPFIEGAWMNKLGGKYYLQYAAPGTEYNVYADGVYESDAPLGEFKYAQNNPYSYKPGGFIRAAGHGSTMQDKYGNLWHISSMQVSVGHRFERRLGLFPAGVDEDGELFCNQRYGDFPMAVEDKKFDPWREPECFLLSYGKAITASSEEKPAESAVDENIRTWWRAKKEDKRPWLLLDLGETCSVKGVQINFADEGIEAEIPEGSDAASDDYQVRYIDDRQHFTRWLLEGSTDGTAYFPVCDKRSAETDLPHDYIPCDVRVRYLRLTVQELPYGQQAAVSGLRVFGCGNGEKPRKAELTRAVRTGDLDAELEWSGNGTGYTALWGHSPEKLYHSYTVYGKTALALRALNKGQRTWVRIDSFNENGITHGDVKELEE